jgi:hypothetical protein
MAVHLYALSWNEMRMLEFFFRHYSWVDRFVFYDDGSTDGTLDMLRADSRVEVRRFRREFPDSVVASAVALFDRCWMESRGQAAWVIITDIDEHLYHPRLDAYLRGCKRSGVTLMPALGYQMYAREFPNPGEHLARTRTQGAPFVYSSKLRIFDPDAIEAINWSPGGHIARPRGRLVLPERDELLLLHYKHLGLDYVVDRYQLLRTGLGKTDLKNGWGRHYLWSRADVIQMQSDLAARLLDLADPSHLPWRDHHEPRWWRNPREPQWRSGLVADQVAVNID